MLLRRVEEIAIAVLKVEIVVHRILEVTGLLEFLSEVYLSAA